MSEARDQKPDARAACSAVLVAHGSPSNPEIVETFMAELAVSVEALTAGLAVRSATLAKTGSLGAALESAEGETLIYPFFMSDGWFVSNELPRRIERASPAPSRILAPFGKDEAMPDYCADLAAEAASEAGLTPAETVLLIAAHGSPSDHRPGATVWAIADQIQASGRFLDVRAGFVDEKPKLEDLLTVTRPAVCLPFFATPAGHVLLDLPAAVAAAGYTGPIAPVVGAAPGTAAIIARALTSS